MGSVPIYFVSGKNGVCPHFLGWYARGPASKAISGETAMIGYVTLGTKDLKRAAAFYDALLKELGAKRMMENDKFIAWSAGAGPGIGLTYPFDGKPATVGNGVMVALAAGSKEQVNAIHKKALQLGARDEGAPG